MSEARTRAWLARALAEAALVVFAVLVALAVDEWWEGRENRALADRTMEAVAREVERNREQLLAKGGGGEPGQVLAELGGAIAAYRTGEEPGDLAVTWDVVLLSSAAWETAQLTRTTQHMELDRVIELAEVYELQRFYTRNQDELASLIADLGSRMETEPVAVLSQLRSRLATTAGLRETLATVYACTLADLSGPDAVEPGACPAEGAGGG